MRISTIYKTLLCFILFIYITLPNARAQIVDEEVCDYEDPQGCFFVAYEAVQEESPTSTELVIILNASLNEGGNCNDIDGLAFLPTGGTNLVFRSRAQLDASPFVELTVNRALFTTVPDVIIYTYENVTVQILGFSFTVRVPTEVIDLQARLDSENPCLEITPLPVELVSFEGTASENNVALKWSTASEQDNKQFEVEHSTDGLSFSQIGIVEGHGNSSAPISYAYVHQNPASGTNYYRLKQVDFSGAFEYSKVIAVTYAGAANSDMQVTVFPNPCQNGDCQVRISNLHSAPETVLELKDMSGKVVFRKAIRNEGQAAIALPLQELGAYRGIYILTASTGTKVVHKRVVLQ